MFKALKYLLVGFLFGIVLTKSEAVSWYRIYEMFHFQSFHMYGIIGVAVTTGLIGMQLVKRFQIKNIKGTLMQVEDKEKGSARYCIVFIFFVLCLAFVGCCPGQSFILLGAGFFPVVLVLLGALLGTFVYGLFKDILPH